MTNNLFNEFFKILEIEKEEISEETAAEIILLNNEIIECGFSSELGIGESILRCIKAKKPIIKSNILCNIRNNSEKRIEAVKIYDEITTKLLSLGVIKSYNNSSVNFIANYLFYFYLTFIF